MMVIENRIFISLIDFVIINLPMTNYKKYFVPILLSLNIPNFHGNFDHSKKNLYTINKKTFSQPPMHNDTRYKS